MHVQLEPTHELLGKPVGFWKEVTGVDRNDGGSGRDSMNQVQHDRGRGAKARRRDQPIAVPFDSPLDELLGGRGSDGSILLIEVGIDRFDTGDFHGCGLT